MGAIIVFKKFTVISLMLIQNKIFQCSDLMRRQEELRRMEELHNQEMQKRKEMQLR